MKKVLTYLLSMVMVAALAISGTVAYLQYEDSDVNVMTLGNVKIEQHEFQRVVNADGSYKTIDVDGITSYELEEFEQAKPLYPFVGKVDAGYDSIPVRLGQLGHNSRGGMDVFPAKNVQDKFVVVENTGTSDAYVRTIVAFEAGSVVEEDWCELISYSAHFTWKETQDWFVTEINGNNYYIVEFVYNGYQDIQHPNGVLKPGDYTYNSLAQVYMFDHATNEDVEALDGNDNGTFDILVLSQAVQTNGFDNALTALDTAFGDTNEENVKVWFDNEQIPGVYKDYLDLYFGGYYDNGNYVLSNDIKADDGIFCFANDISIDLNGKEITAAKKDQYVLGAFYGAKLNLTGNGTVDGGKGFMASTGNAEIIIDGGTYNFTAYNVLNGYRFTSLVQNDSKIVINGGKFTTNLMDTALFFVTTNSILEINGGFFENTVDDTPDLLDLFENKYQTNRIILKGGTFVNWNPLEDKMCYTGVWPEAGESAFSGPWMLIPGDYEVVSETQSNGDIWYFVVQK